MNKDKNWPSSKICFFSQLEEKKRLILTFISDLFIPLGICTLLLIVDFDNHLNIFNIFPQSVLTGSTSDRNHCKFMIILSMRIIGHF